MFANKRNQIEAELTRQNLQRRRRHRRHRRERRFLADSDRQQELQQVPQGPLHGAHLRCLSRCTGLRVIRRVH